MSLSRTFSKIERGIKRENQVDKAVPQFNIPCIDKEVQWVIKELILQVG